MDQNMSPEKSLEISRQIEELQTLMVAYVTDGREKSQPGRYKELYSTIHVGLEQEKYQHPNPHKSLELLWAHCKLKDLDTYASRRAYIDSLYADVLLDLKRIQMRKPISKAWTRANEVLEDELAPVRIQWLKAKNFIYAEPPDFENSVKESINSIESCLKILLKDSGGTLGKLIKSASLDAEIERLISQAYGLISNKDFVRHGGTAPSTLGKIEAEFFLDFCGSSIAYISAKLKTLK
jgi:hypothetical protein